MNRLHRYTTLRARWIGILLLPYGFLAGLDRATADEPDVFPMGRLLLTASDGLYLLERDGSCSWLYNPTPYKGQGWVEYDDLIYDGWPLDNGNFLYAAHRYVRTVDRQKRTVWEYRVEGKTEVKSCVPLPDGNVAVLNSQEQAILELEQGTGKVLHRIAVPAKGDNHTRYNLLRRTPAGTYLVALRAESRFVEVNHGGNELLSLGVPSLPVMAMRLADGTTMCSGQFGLKQFSHHGQEVWSFTPEDAAPHFPLLYTGGFVQLLDLPILAVNSDWHYKKAGDNRVSMFLVNHLKEITWTLPSSAFGEWKRSEVEPATGLKENRLSTVQFVK